MGALPLVSCIMPTRGRPAFVKQAIALFFAQDYPSKELIVYESEAGSVTSETLTAVLREMEAPIRYAYTTQRPTIGAARNQACYCSTRDVPGQLIAHWDDDDWHAPNRLSASVAALQATGARLVGLDQLVFYDGARAYLYRSVRNPWLAGGTFLYEKSLWREQPFSEVSNGEDVAFLDAAHRRGVRVVPISDPSLYVARIHPGNTDRKAPDHQWGGFDVAMVRQWLGEEQAA